MITFDDIYHVGIIVPGYGGGHGGARPPLRLRLARPLHRHRPVVAGPGSGCRSDRILTPRVTFCDQSTPKRLIALELIEALPGTLWDVGESRRSQLHHFLELPQWPSCYVESVQAAIDELTAPAA